MPFRLRRSIKVMPGVRLHLSKSGPSVSVGTRGASLNIGHGKQSLNVGLPGTGLSFRASAPRATPRTNTVSLVHTIGAESAPADATVISSNPDETMYRIAALLAAASIGGAGEDEVEARIAGILPEWLPNGLSSVLMSKGLLALALGRDGTSYQGTAAVRRAMTRCGFNDTALVSDAVAAVRASVKARGDDPIDKALPLQWYRENGQLLSREFEAPALRARYPSNDFKDLHRQQLELGTQRLQDPKLLRPANGSLSGGKFFLLILGAVAVLTVLFTAAILSLG